MRAAVPLARKYLFHDRRRLALAVLGIGAAFVLVLVLDGIFAGAMRQVTAYIRNSPAEIFIAQADVETMHMTSSALPPSTVQRAAQIEGVAWVEGLHYSGSTLDTGTDSQLTYVFGYDTSTQRGGPRRLISGTTPGHGEIVVDSAAADELGINLGDQVTVLGQPFRISGLSIDGTYIANTTVFITSEDFEALRGPSFAYLLVGADPGTSVAALRSRLAEALPDTNVMTRQRFAQQEANVVRSMAGDIMAIMTVIGFLIALTLIALTLFTATLARQRDYGVLKALGATTRRLLVVVLAQAAWTVTLAFVIGVTLSLAIGRAVEALTPNLAVDIELATVARTALAAVVIGAIGALIPLRRVARVDPSTAFKRL